MIKRLSLCTLAALAISACAPAGKEAEDTPTKTPFGYEFAHMDVQQSELRE